MKKKVEIIKTRANKIAVGIFLLFISTLYCPKQLFASEFIEVQQQQDQKKVTLNMKDRTLVNILSEIKRQTGLAYGFRDNRDATSNERFSIQVKEVSVDSALSVLLKESKYSYQIVGDLILISTKKDITTEDQKNLIMVKGTVVDENGNPIPGATILVHGTSRGIASDMEGRYSIEAKPDDVLKITFVGYKDEVIPIKGKTKIDVRLNPTVENIEEVAVVAFGTQKKESVVSAITTVDASMLKSSNSDLTSQFAGKIAGMIGWQQGGIPGALTEEEMNTKFYIRGITSFQSGANIDPLILLDGVEASKLDLARIDPEDIETFSVMKDASATAIYGSRAANGVVLVTTKRGKKGMKPTLEFSARYGIQTMNANDFGVLNAEEYIALSKAAVRASFFTRGSLDYFTRKYIDETKFNASTNHSQFDLETLTDDFFLKDAYYDGDTDWWDLMTHNAATQEYSLGIRGGSKESSYSASFFYKDQKGIVKGGSSKLLGGSFNFDASIREVIRFKLGLRATSRVTNDKDDMISTILDMRPDYPAYLEDGSINMISYYVENPLFTLKNTDEGKGKDFTGSLGLEWDIIPGLTLRTNGTLKYGINKTLTYKRKYYDDGTSSSSVAKNENYTYVWDNTLTYLKTLGDHNLVGLLGFSIEKYEYDGLSASGSNFPDDEVLTNLGSAATKNSIASSYNSNTLVSTFARLEYKFKNRYLATFTFRADGSSKFGPDKRWGYFPSGALAWIISEENFLKDYSHIVSYLKLRASIGKTGSQNLGNYDWRTLMGSATYNGAPGIKPSSLGNDILQWESQVQKEIGLDYGFWDDRIRGSIGYYQKKVDNLLYSDPVPYSSSFSSVTQNIGSLKNKGFEFDVKVDIIKNTQKDLTWDFDFNVARNITTLEKLNSEDEYFGGGAYQYFKIDVGGKTGILYGYKYGGRLIRTNEELVALKTINPETGQQQYYRDENNYERPGDLYIMDLDGDGQITADGDRTEIGNANPDFFGGFGTTLYWKGLMVNATFTYSVGADRFYDEEKSSAGDMNVYNTSKNTLKSWTMNPGVDRGYPRAMYYGWGSNSIITNRYVHDASFLRLSALNISYRLPKRLFGSSIVDAIDLTFQATNLFTWTKYPGMDPQGNFSTSYSAFYNMGIDYSSYPSARTYNVGIKITLK